MPKTLFTAEAASDGGRSGSLHTPDGLLNISLGNPLEHGLEKRGPSPELLFAGAYAACFHGAVVNAVRRMGTPSPDPSVRVQVSLQEEDTGGYRLAVVLHAHLPGVPRTQAQHILEEAHKTCPYSKAMRGDVTVTLTVDSLKP